MNVGDLRTRISDGVVVEILAVNDAAQTVRAVPYAVMAGARRLAPKPHPDQHVDRPMSDFRDVEDADLAPAREALHE